MEKNSKIFVAGGAGLVGSAIIRNLKSKGYTNIISSYNKRRNPDSEIQNIEINLIDSVSCERFFAEKKPDYVFLAAAKVGGIHANSVYRGQFLFENLQIQNNIIHFAYKYGTKKLLFLGSSCIYPKTCPQPMKEEYLLTNILEYTNEPYAIAKIAGLKLCESYNLQYGTNFISAMPTNLYGDNDNFHLENSHVLPAMIRKIYLASCLEKGSEGIEKIRGDFRKNQIESVNPECNDNELIIALERFGIFDTKPVSLKLWGSGTPRREFLHSDDLADACVFIMQNIDFADIIKSDFDIDDIKLPPQKEIRNTHINIGTGHDVSIKELAETISDIIGFKGILDWDDTKPDGTFQKLLDVSKLNKLGWHDKIDFREGIKKIYEKYIA